jgi:replicative DNA helicase Mcm
MGLAVIDEMDKMTDQDRSAMHEGMESQRVSVAKAGITASLQCRCSVLGIANPKYGRFDSDQPLAEQIDLPPALLSRFDLIFALLDKPNPERDRSIAEHICRGHQRAGALKHANEGDAEADSILASTEDLTPVYDRDRVRKYLLYARSCQPILTTAAMTARYLSIRAMSDVRNGAATVPISPRQMEAFIRLAEASAKLRLSKRVEAQDAQRAVDIVQEYLRSFGTSEGGTPDIDRISTGRSSKDRQRLQSVESIIKDRKDLSMDELITDCKAHGIGEAEVNRVVDKLKDTGRLYEPTVGRLRVIA